MRRQRVRIQVRLDGELYARDQGRYLNIARRDRSQPEAEPASPKPARHDHNAGGQSAWMQGFFDRPSPPLGKSLG